MSEKSNLQYPPTTKVGTKTWYALKFFLSLFDLFLILSTLYLIDMLFSDKFNGRYVLTNLGVLKPVWDSFVLLILILGAIYGLYFLLSTIFAKKRITFLGGAGINWVFVKKD